MQQASLAKWGNSLALRIPKQIADIAGWKIGDQLEFAAQKESITVKKKRNIKTYNLSDTMGSFHSAKEANFDWGTPVGREVW